MHSCEAEKVLRKKRQEFRFDWGMLLPDVAPATPEAPARTGKSPFLISCGQCEACYERVYDLCKGAFRL